MNTLATRHPATLPEEGERDPARVEGAARVVRVRETSRERQGSVFILGSIAMHVGLFLGFSGAESHALVPPAREEMLEIEYQAPEPKAPLPEPEAALPRGTLDAPPSLHRSSSPPLEAPPMNAPRPSEERPTAEAPAVLTSDNPYASDNSAVFTSGTGSGSGPVVSAPAAAATPTFGVSGGAVQVDPHREKELRSWRARVQQELARLATQNYPRRALKLGQQGTAKVTVTIDESGTLVGASLVQRERSSQPRSSGARTPKSGGEGFRASSWCGHQPPHASYHLPDQLKRARRSGPIAPTQFSRAPHRRMNLGAVRVQGVQWSTLII